MSTPKVDYVGPFRLTRVVMDGRRVPFLDATLLPGGRVTLTLDDRFDLDLTVTEAEKVVPFVAECIAVGLGYTSHPRGDEEPNRATPFPRMIEITSSTTEDA